MVSFLDFVTLALALTSSAAAFPAYGSLAGLPREALDGIIPALKYRRAEDPPSPINFTGTMTMHIPGKPPERVTCEVLARD
jgi:hypothetical protein